MKPGSAKRIVFSGCLVILLLASIAGVLVLVEYSAGLIIARTADYPHARKILSGEAKGSDAAVALDPDQNVVGQPYLLYVPAPNYAKMGHNEHGYRGDLVPVRRSPAVRRILFIGGSTTYGWTVLNAVEAYPAQVKAEWEKKHPSERIEVINAGLPWGTSAEHLTHYLYKFRYYKPDLLVIDCGGNDAQANDEPFYHPDFSHWRQELHNLRPLPPNSRWIMKSNLTALFMLNCFQIEGVSKQRFVKDSEKREPVAPWMKGVLANNPQTGRQEIPDDFLAFRKNVETLIREALADGVRVMLVPFRAKPENGYTPSLNEYMRRHEAAMKEFAGKYGLVMAPFPGDVISPGNWGDNLCHLNPAGENEKARHVLPYVEEALARPAPVAGGVSAPAPASIPAAAPAPAPVPAPAEPAAAGPAEPPAAPPAAAPAPEAAMPPQAQPPAPEPSAPAASEPPPPPATAPAAADAPTTPTA